ASSLDLHDLCLLALDTGLRRGEACALQWQHIDMESMTLRITDPKDVTSRSVYPGSLYTAAVVMLRRRHTQRASAYVFPGRDGGMRCDSAVTRQFAKILDLTGLNRGYDDPRLHLTFHGLRHAHATRMLEKGVDIYTLKDLMGHESLATTERYLHLCDRTKRAKAMQGGHGGLTIP
ncbi:MAG: tyrosine-type recombinase/integrase, partial [Desulfovibrionaceae bacterium]